MKNECEGCIAYYSEEKKCCRLGVIPCISESLQCPCRTCIIKVICDNTCEDFMNYVTKSSNILNGIE